MPIEHYINYGGPSRDRRTAHALDCVNRSTSLAIAHIQAREDIQAAAVEALVSVTQRGLQGVAFISQVEQQLAQVVPVAAPRLQGIADIGALGISQVIMQSANKLRRA